MKTDKKIEELINEAFDNYEIHFCELQNDRSLSSKAFSLKNFYRGRWEIKNSLCKSLNTEVQKQVEERVGGFAEWSEKTIKNVVKVEENSCSKLKDYMDLGIKIKKTYLKLLKQYLTQQSLDKGDGE